jgi:kanosamine-6-phosphate phosphatase
MPLSTHSRAEPASLPRPRIVRNVAFSDFDETYLAHNPTPERISARETLEDYLTEASERHGLLFGWVTGSSLASVMSKVRTHNLRALPHFLACSLGTELLFFDHGPARPDVGWRQRMPELEHLTALVDAAVRDLARQGIPLAPQERRDGESLVKSYYYRMRDPVSDAGNLAAVAETAARLSLGVNLSRCNPLSGDPEDCYDVDFLPEHCGKKAVAEYVCGAHGVSLSDAFAFGDSGNDLELLAVVGRGVLVGNCTPEARAGHPHQSERTYADAILLALKERLG